MRAAAVVKNKTGNYGKSQASKSGSVTVDTEDTFTKNGEKHNSHHNTTQNHTQSRERHASVTSISRPSLTSKTNLTYTGKPERIDRSYYQHSAKRTAELYKKHKYLIQQRNRELFEQNNQEAQNQKNNRNFSTGLWTDNPSQNTAESVHARRCMPKISSIIEDPLNPGVNQILEGDQSLRFKSDNIAHKFAVIAQVAQQQKSLVPPAEENEHRSKSIMEVVQLIVTRNYRDRRKSLRRRPTIRDATEATKSAKRRASMMLRVGYLQDNKIWL